MWERCRDRAWYTYLHFHIFPCLCYFFDMPFLHLFSFVMIFHWCGGTASSAVCELNVFVSHPPSSIMSLSLMLRASCGSHLLSSSPSSSLWTDYYCCYSVFLSSWLPITLTVWKEGGGRFGTLNHRHYLSVCRRMVFSGIQTCSYNSGLELIQRIENLSSLP